MRHLLLLTPIVLIPAIESVGAGHAGAGFAAVRLGDASVAGRSPSICTARLALYGLRRWCLANADRFLGRLTATSARRQ